MEKRIQIQDIMLSNDFNTLPKVLEGLFEVFQAYEVTQLESITSTIVDLQFLEELKRLPENVNIAFGENLRDIKCSITDSDLRKHDIYLKYDGNKKIRIVSVDLPFTSFNEQIYNSIEELVAAFLKHTENLQNYFYELENIDCNCVVMEPAKPMFKDDFRNIRIDDKTWLHIEVTCDGSATNIHLIGQSEMWQDRLQKGLLAWDQDKNIVENIMSIFDLKNDMLCSSTLMIRDIPRREVSEETQGIVCAICFSTELPDDSGLPQPLCQNVNCDVHFHKSCLFQWLVACEGGRPPAFGVINGSCPTCLQPISCTEKG